jgi:hypothetical protein
VYRQTTCERSCFFLASPPYPRFNPPFHVILTPGNGSLAFSFPQPLNSLANNTGIAPTLLTIARACCLRAESFAVRALPTGLGTGSFARMTDAGSSSGSGTVTQENKLSISHMYYVPVRSPLRSPRDGSRGGTSFRSITVAYLPAQSILTEMGHQADCKVLAYTDPAALLRSGCNSW